MTVGNSFFSVSLIKDIAVCLNVYKFTRKLAKMLISLTFSNDPCVSHEAILSEQEKSHV